MTNKNDPDWLQAGDNTLHGAIDHWQGEAARLKAENEALRARVERLTHCAKESQTWNWISAQEAGFEQAMDRYDIDDMQDLHEIAHDETPAQSVAHIRAAGAREALQRAMETPGFSDTVIRVDQLRAIIEQMEGEA